MAAAIPFAARAVWSPPETGFDLLRGMRLERYDSTTQAGLDAYGNAVAGDAMVLGIFKAGLMHSRFCIKDDIKYADVILVVRAWLEQNTDRLAENATALADAALLKAFPCR